MTDPESTIMKSLDHYLRSRGYNANLGFVTHSAQYRLLPRINIHHNGPRVATINISGTTLKFTFTEFYTRGHNENTIRIHQLDLNDPKSLEQLDELLHIATNAN